MFSFSTSIIWNWITPWSLPSELHNIIIRRKLEKVKTIETIGKGIK